MLEHDSPIDVQVEVHASLCSTLINAYGLTTQLAITPIEYLWELPIGWDSLVLSITLRAPFCRNAIFPIP